MALPPDMMKDAPPSGVMETCEPGIRRILAPNPSPHDLLGHKHLCRR